MQEIGKFDQKINIPNGMEKDMVFMLGKNSIDSAQVMDSSSENSVKNVPNLN